MKHSLAIMAATLLLSVGAMAQSHPTNDKMLKQWRSLIHQRDYSSHHLSSDLPTLEPSKSTAPHKALPQDRVWFPGEWEEVKAIVVTVYYNYVPLESQGAGTWMADPLVSGVAEYYKYSSVSGWIDKHIKGPYKAVIDTNSNFGKTFFYLMDGIQLGGAQAWVRVESVDDTAIVLRTLQRLNLRHDNVRFIVGTGNSFWYRDCGPICFYYGSQDSVAMLDFEYYPGRALDDSLCSHIHRQMGIPNYINTIEWEGGNCLVDGAGLLFTSDAVYPNNSDALGQITWNGCDLSSIGYTSKTRLSQSQTKAALQALLGQRETHVLPAYRYDGGTGHIDLYADMWDENSFVFSIMPQRYSQWTDYRTGARNIDSLCSYSSIHARNYFYDSIPFPKTDNGTDFSSQVQYNDYYTRTYSNHTFVNNVILQPVFSKVVNGQPSAAWDKNNFEMIKAAYPGYTLYPIDVREFDGSGGAIHCITKQIPADNPVRILHKTVVGNANGLIGHDVPVSAVITNKSGIAHAECFYRFDGGDWNTVALNANGNKFSALLPTAAINPFRFDTIINTIIVIDTSFNDDSTIRFDTVVVYDTVLSARDTMIKVEYYISATSNNGKTITKPMTAAQGGYFNFFYNNEPIDLDSSDYDFSTVPRPAEDITFVFADEYTYFDTNDAPTPYPWTGIQDASQLDNSIGLFYPNPSHQQANIDLDLGNGCNYSISIVDVNGRTIHNTSLYAAGHTTFSINTSKLPNGIYIVTFSNGTVATSRRLVVQ